jgi:hypothetical protein
MKQRKGKPWTREEAHIACIMVEKIVRELGCHVALTGGCCYDDANGSGTHGDLDLILYAVRGTKPVWTEVINAIRTKMAWQLEGHYGWLWQFTHNHAWRVDIMIPEINEGAYYD